MIRTINIHHGHSRPLTEDEAKVMLACFAILTFIWIVSSIFNIRSYFKRVKLGYSPKFSEFYFFPDTFIQSVLHIIGVLGWGITLLIYLGSLLAKLF